MPMVHKGGLRKKQAFTCYLQGQYRHMLLPLGALWSHKVSTPCPGEWGGAGSSLTWWEGEGAKVGAKEWGAGEDRKEGTL